MSTILYAVQERNLADGETIRVSPGSLVAFEVHTAHSLTGGSKKAVFAFVQDTKTSFCLEWRMSEEEGHYSSASNTFRFFSSEHC